MHVVKTGNDETVKKRSAGIVLYRKRDRVEVLLVHPGGPYWANTDEGAWSIPKGEFDPGENSLDAARREFREETGKTVEGHFAPLGSARQPTGKVIHAWMVEGDFDQGRIHSNTFVMEWPPRSKQLMEFNEVDRAGWFDLNTAKRKISKGQIPLIERLEQALARGRQVSGTGNVSED